ncbi:hypothetical protein GJ496_010006 [Pomphorhynchus laevis]|nr:hypothetical protein GJ496_010006 [Pomphorhynchus laevis]
MVAKLSIISDIYSQIAYLGFTKSLQSKWSYFLRATKIDPSLLQDLKSGIFSNFVKQLTKQSLDHNWHSLLSLPVRLASLGIDDPTRSCSLEYDMDQRLCQTFQSGVHGDQLHKLQNKIGHEISEQSRNIFLERLGRVKSTVDQSVNHYIDHANIKGAGLWLT